MKYLILITSILISFTSCSKKMIQVFETSSIDSKLIDSNWVSENDTIKITYWFWANKGVMSFSIYNKLDKPIYIDWKSSSFIYNGLKLDYWIESEKISQISSASYYYRGPLITPQYTTLETSSSIVTKPEKITFIPPKSYYYRSSFYLQPYPFEVSKKIENQDTVPNYANPDKKAIIYYEDFNFENSPLKFRNYLAFSFSEGSQNLFFISDEFYLSSIKQMSSSTYLGTPTGYKTYNSGKVPVYGKSPYVKQTSFYFEF